MQDLQSVSQNDSPGHEHIKNFTNEQAYFEFRSIYCCLLFYWRPWANPYSTIISAYTGRSLTYESNSPNAFIRILQEFRNVSFPIYQYWCLPIESGESGVAIWCFAILLSWTHGTALRRRLAVASCSWVCWGGQAAAREYETKENALHMYFRKNASLPSVGGYEYTGKNLAITTPS